MTTQNAFMIRQLIQRQLSRLSHHRRSITSNHLSSSSSSSSSPSSSLTPTSSLLRTPQPQQIKKNWQVILEENPTLIGWFVLWFLVLMYVNYFYHFYNDIQRRNFYPATWVYYQQYLLSPIFWVLKLYFLLVNDPDSDPQTEPTPQSIVYWISRMRVTLELFGVLMPFVSFEFNLFQETLYDSLLGVMSFIEYYHDITVRQLQGYRSYHSVAGMWLRSINMGNVSFIATQPVFQTIIFINGGKDILRSTPDDFTRGMVCCLHIFLAFSWFTMIDDFAQLKRYRTDYIFVARSWCVFLLLSCLSSELSISYGTIAVYIGWYIKLITYDEQPWIRYIEYILVGYVCARVLWFYYCQFWM